ncbi:class I mannose-6-phosphate isomerase [Sphingomonas sp. R647]|uniref:class I mannose-6-phosphate isomerase n=1 Tax=Sphingomonas sp. R647 TaxID=2875233 RepID=UPI001CD3F836|nr:class I mannose-6-phosphate isomerase [Sphingomonas sp. R647]MCA1196375.1 class I mannose-6-phosphate isomerase [Sphingomonas sp. R647]
MTAQHLAMHRVEKPWGRKTLWPGFPEPAGDDAPIGEIWFQSPGSSEPELLVKYLFTSERLSIQVHPDDAQARALGYPRGKDEAWLVLAADPGATIGLGTVKTLGPEALREAALDGSIEAQLDWKPVKAGDFIYAPARTVHAIGPGLTLIEIQQNVDLTYRLYDYGRARELHLDLGVEVSDARPFEFLQRPDQGVAGAGRELLAAGPKFVIERRRGGDWSIDLADITGWFVPVEGEGQVDAVSWRAGECLAVSGKIEVIANPEADILLAYPGVQAL